MKHSRIKRSSVGEKTIVAGIPFQCKWAIIFFHLICRCLHNHFLWSRKVNIAVSCILCIFRTLEQAWKQSLHLRWSSLGTRTLMRRYEIWNIPLWMKIVKGGILVQMPPSPWLLEPWEGAWSSTSAVETPLLTSAWLISYFWTRSHDSHFWQ